MKFTDDVKGLPSNCPYEQTFDVIHTMNCKTEVFVVIRHNDIRDFEANLYPRVTMT